MNGGGLSHALRFFAKTNWGNRTVMVLVRVHVVVCPLWCAAGILAEGDLVK